jgi:hypothetical protein
MSITSKDYVLGCENKTKLSCSTNYYKLVNNNRVTETVSAESTYDLINWDEPSLSYCKANVAFNKNGLYISADLTEPNIGEISIAKNSVNGKMNDYFSAKSIVDENNEFKISMSLSTENNTTSVFGVEVTCKVIK